MTEPHRIITLIHIRLDSKVGFDRTYSRDLIFRMLGETYHVPKKYRDEFIIELEKFNLIKPIDSKLMEIELIK